MRSDEKHLKGVPVTASGRELSWGPARQLLSGSRSHSPVCKEPLCQNRVLYPTPFHPKRRGERHKRAGSHNPNSGFSQSTLLVGTNDEHKEYGASCRC